MSYASCKFPLLDKWKGVCDKNGFLGFIDSVLSGYAQIVLSDNTLTGLLFVIACFANGVSVGVASLVSALTATLAAKIFGTPDILLRMGLYTFSAALAGIGVGVLVFPGQGVGIAMILVAMICGLICAGLTAGLSFLLAPYKVPAFSLPFCIVLALLIPSSIRFFNLSATTGTMPYLNVATEAADITAWTVSDFFTAVINNFAEVLFQANTMTGVFVLAGLLCSSRVDTLSAIIASCVATLTAIGLGLPTGLIMAGLAGYNAIFLFVTIFGRAFAMSARSFAIAIIASISSVFVYAGLGAWFAPLAIPVAAFPFAFIAITLMLTRESFTKLRFVEALYWGVPETIAKMLKKQDSEAKEGNVEEQM